MTKAHLDRENKRLRKALEFYSDTANLAPFVRVLLNDPLLNPNGPPDAYGISDDVCLTARAALSTSRELSSRCNSDPQETCGGGKQVGARHTGEQTSPVSPVGASRSY